MGLSVGQQLGSYEITALLGKGGMGEVYRARDAKLKRDVAIKVLPDEFSGDTDRVSRFQREAEVLAALNHPNIAGIHDLQATNDARFLVLELVEGETLAEVIENRGALPVDEVLEIALQICDALEAAHEKGIIHRDLKPANVKITPDRKVKVLDFGLAKALGTDPMNGTLSNSPTLLSANAGVAIVGTAAYMSPEQARGRPADHRSDVFSFGCVFYEMLTGKQAFQGEDVSDVLASVLRAEPDPTLLPSNLHPLLRRLISRCLSKNRKDRWHAIADLRLELEYVLAEQQTGADLTRAAEQRPLWRRIVPVAAAIIATSAACVVLTLILLDRAPVPASPIVTRFAFFLPEGHAYTTTARKVVTISPDGAQIAYTANSRLFLKSMGEMQARVIEGAGQNPSNPFFSPDGRWVGFLASDNKLKKIAVTGGAAVTIGDIGGADATFGASWGADDQILMGRARGIAHVPASGGKPEMLFTLKDEETAHGPQLLPGGDAVLFTLGTGAGNEIWDRAQIVVQSLKSGERKVLIESGGDARYLPTGHLVYAVGTTLLAVAFDAANLQVTGGPVSIVDGVRRTNRSLLGGASSQFDVSSQGTLVYLPANAGAGPEALYVALVDRVTGVAKLLDIPAAPYNTPRVSPNGRQLALWTQDEREDVIWIYDLTATLPLRRLTFGGRNHRPIWTKDSQRVTFTSNADAEQALMWQRADGSGPAERLFKTAPSTSLQSESWSADGKTLLVNVNPGTGQGTAISIISPEADGKLQEIIKPGGNLSLSADGRWIAHNSFESGRQEVYVKPFPPTGSQYLVSTEGGINPVWSPDGKQLFYAKPGSNQIVSVDIQTQPTFVIGKTTPLPIQGIVLTGARDYDITPDGKHFVVLLPRIEKGSTQPTSEQIHFTLNWFTELQQRVPVDR